MTCCVPDCKITRRLLPPESDVTFHRLSKGEMFEKYSNILGLQNMEWRKTLFICSKHFQPSDFIQKMGKKYLNNNAVPSLNLPSCISSSPTPPKKQKLSKSMFTLEKLMEPGSSTAAEEVGTTSSSRPFDENIGIIPTVLFEMPAEKKAVVESSTKLERKDSNFSIGGSSSGSLRKSLSSSTSSDTKKRRVGFIKRIHNYSWSPTVILNKNMKLKSSLRKASQKLAQKQRTIKKLKHKIFSLKTVIQKLQRTNMLSTNGIEHLEKTLEGVPKVLISRYLKNSRLGTTSREEYPPDLRRFAMTLHFFSNKAYEFVRKEFKLSLPHQSTIRKWCTAIDCKPGFQKECFTVLEEITNKMSERGHMNLCGLLFDEMSIKKKIDMNGFGYVNLGIPDDSDDLEPATEALVLMVVCYTGSWKLPIAYFFIKSLTGKEKANLIREALTRLDQIGVHIASITCDGPNSHFAMFKELGCDWSNLNSIKPYFLHPTNGKKVFAIFDVCHMIKLLRNHFSYLNVLVNNGEVIRWDYIIKLHQIQEKQGLKLAAKLKRAHINWESQKMKVNLSTQVFSSSVAKALAFLKDDLHYTEFKDCQPTITFIESINHLFDILNSVNPFAKGYKSPLRRENEHIFRHFLIDMIAMLTSLKNGNGDLIKNTRKKTPIIGLAISITSIIGIFDEFVKTNVIPYFLTYKCSQDHLELFFCCIRSRNGWNNNPSCFEFHHSFKKLLLHAKIPGEGGNVRVLDSTNILSVSSKAAKTSVLVSNMDRFNDIEIDVIDDHDYDPPINLTLDMYTQNVVTYICGYVVKMVSRVIHCDECLSQITLPTKNIIEDNYKFLRRKDMGGLIFPSKSVTEVCYDTEIFLRKILEHTERKIPKEEHIVEILTNVVFNKISGKILKLFPMEGQHRDTSRILDEHPFFLSKAVITAYLRIRLFNLAKTYSEEVQGDSIRQKLNKLILFHHQ